MKNRAEMCSGCRLLPPTVGYRTCERCRAYQARAFERNERAGLCRCGKARDGDHKSCAACIARVRAQRDKRARAGLCEGICGRPRIDGSPYCADCKRKQSERHRASSYGVSPAQYEQKAAAQGGRCALCGERPSGPSKAGQLYIDHDHRTGEIRDLLCHHCNAAIGSLREDPALCRAAAAYLERWALRVAS